MSARWLALLAIAPTIAAACAVSAQTPSADERFYQAIRHDDLALLRGLIDELGPNVSDPQGHTPLMAAAAFGSSAAVRLLIDNGARVRAASGGGVTALHWAATDAAKVRMLLDADADPAAWSMLGRTPLIVAASATGTSTAVRMLLAAGADVNAADALGVTPLIAAAGVGDTEVATLLLAHGANPSARAGIPHSAAPLLGAAFNGDLTLLRELIARRVDLAAISAPGVQVKNGPIQFGQVTALHMAVAGGTPHAVTSLLEAGATVDAEDIRGMTPLMWAVATDRPHAGIVQALLSADASRTARSRLGDSVIDWARRFNDGAVLRELGLSSEPPVAPPLAPSHGRATPRQAVERSLPLLRLASGRMLTDGGCVACHAQPMTAMAVGRAAARGWTAAPPSSELVQGLAMLAADAPAMLQLREGGGWPDTQLYVALMLGALGTAPTRATDALVHYLAAKQRPDGYWRGIGATRAPIQDGNISRTALSIRALTLYATPARTREYTERLARAAAWLQAQQPLTTEDRVMQLLGLQWSGTGESMRERGVQDLLGLQNPDGGWSQTPHLSSDAYATGQVLHTLRELGAPADAAALQRGAAFLLRTQHADGSWYVRSRAMKIQPYFESGFPHGHDQWISQIATAWATMALTATAIE